ncbi:MAG: hypothetical protein JSR84_01105 [Proteobacteria bacterium]|nr:hypothetical protein [Pseudomonadota bacterium]
MNADDIRTYSGLRLLPAAVILLNVDQDAGARRWVTIEPVERAGSGGRTWMEDEVTVNWTRLEDPRRSSTALRLTAFARSMLDGTPVDVREIDHFPHDAYALFMRALATAWPDPPPSIDQLLASGWRELTADEFRRRIE